MTLQSATLERRRNGILDEACLRQAHVTVTHRGPLGWRLCNGRFQSDHAGESLQVHIPLSGGRDAPQPGAQVGLTFRRGHKKCIFHSIVHGARRTESEVVLCVDRPSQIQELQRRVFERTVPPANKPIHVTVHLPGDAADGERRIRGRLEDISAGGMRVRVEDVHGIEGGRTCRCVFEGGPSRQALSVDAVLKHAEDPLDSSASLGFQFIGMEASTEGFEVMLELARFVKYLQRCGSTARRGR